jgi:hypothetical protein
MVVSVGLALTELASGRFQTGHRGRPVPGHVCHVWPYAGVGPTSQAEGERRRGATRRCCPHFILPRLALALTQQSGATTVAITAAPSLASHAAIIVPLPYPPHL